MILLSIIKSASSEIDKIDNEIEKVIQKTNVIRPNDPFQW